MNRANLSLRSCLGLGLAIVVAATVVGAVLLGGMTGEVDAAKKPKPAKPNIVFILSDDQRADDLQWMPKTEQLISAKGTVLSRVLAPFPLCCPARMSLMTGQYPHNHGVDGNFPPEGYYELPRKTQEKTLPVWLRKAGYQTSHIGKYLNGYGVKNQTEIPPGWSDWHGSIDQTSYDMFNYWVNDNGKVTKYGNDQWNEAVMEISRKVADRTLTDYNDLRYEVLQKLIIPFQGENSVFGDTSPDEHQVDQLANRAVDFVSKAAPKKAPFFLQFAPPAPHREDLPETAGYRGINPRVPERYLDEVKALEFPADRNPPSFDEADISDKPGPLAGFKPMAEQTNTPPISGLQQIDNYRRGRIGNLWALDDAVERLVETVEEAGELNNTIFIFHSDNGWMMGEHRIPGDKYVPFEESLIVPTVIRGPGWPAGKEVSALASNVDLARTILAATGAKANRTQDGIDLKPLAQGKVKKRKAILIEATRPLFVLPGFPYQWDVPYYGVRTERYKYVNWSYGEEELYDLQSDPYEMENRAADPAYTDTKAELLKLADRLRNCKGSACVAR